MKIEEQKKVLGRAEELAFSELHFDKVPARIDTGAKTSSIWASDIQLDTEGKLHVIFFGSTSKHYTGTPVTFDVFESTAVASSNGQVQQRYKVRLLVRLKGKKVRAAFTLADRSSQVYPVLVGRNVLLGKFVVDVKRGKVLKEEEKRRSEELQAGIERKLETEKK